MKFKHKNGVIVEARNNYEESILKSNNNYTPIIENAQKIEKIVQKEPIKEKKSLKIAQNAVKTAKKDGE